jgi:hypothetical protein
MKWTVRKKFWALLVVMTLGVFPSSALAKVTFADGQYVKLGYSAAPPVWEAKALPGAGTGNFLFLGAPLSTGGGYGDTNVWADSGIRRYFNETYLPTRFPAEELATGILTPYGDAPIYNVVVHGAGYSSLAATPDQGAVIEIPPSSAGDSLVWILDVQEIQSIYNGNPALPWNDAAGNTARLICASGGPYRTRSSDPNDPSLIWTIGSDGGFVRDSVMAPAVVRPVVSPDLSVMLYKRGAGTQAEPCGVCYRWNALPTVTADANGNTITLTFPAPVTNNGNWPGPEAWRITDSRGTSYSVTGTSGTNNRVTLTIFPAVAANATLTVKYTQIFDDAAQGLNNTKGAILKTANAQTPSLHFGLPDITLEASTDGDDGDDGCDCDHYTDGCLCETGVVAIGGCDCGGNGNTNGAGLRILSDSVHYLVPGKTFILDLEAESGTAPYAWSMGEGALPQGLALSTEGAIEGTPDSPGSFRATIQVSDSSGKTASKRFTFLVVEDETLAIMTDTLPDAQAGQFYSARVRGAGGTKPYAWTIEKLPTWLTFDPSSGILSGTPLESAIHDLMARVKDGDGATDSKLLRLSVYPHDGLLVTTRVLPAPIHGQKYSVQLEAFGGGGIPPYVFAPRRGASLPPGLTPDAAGTLSGTPAQKGIYSFVIDAMDGNGLQGSAAFTTVVVAEDVLISGAGDFTVREDEKEKRLHLTFRLPKDFNDAPVLAVEALTSPDLYIAGSSSALMKEENGGYRVELTLYAAEHALNTGGRSWATLMRELSFEGFVVCFRDASGEALRFGKAMPVRDMEKENNGGNGKSGGGCSALGWGFSAFLPLTLCFRLKKKTKNAVWHRD